MENQAKPHPVVKSLFFVFLVTFFGGGLALVVNLFIPFLGEAAFAILALVIMAELLILLVVGKCVQVISALRALRSPPVAARTELDERK